MTVLNFMPGTAPASGITPRPIGDILAELRPALRSNITDLAEHLLGPPNKALSNRSEWRWGSKGAFRVTVSGPRQGGCADFGGDFKGGPLDLIMHVRGCDFTDAVLWGAAWAGIATDGRTAAPVDPAVMQARDAARKAEATRKQAEAEREEAKRIAAARLLWDRSTAPDGTVAERYLIEARSIPRPASGWPDAVRFHASSRSLILAGTDSAGGVRFVQRVRLTADGRKIDGGGAVHVKETSGVMAGAFVRLPGPADGPLLTAEGPETGLSVWAATGAETRLSIGPIIRHEPPIGRPVVVCRDDDAADEPLNKALAAWRGTGADVTVATPWPERRRDKTDFNDVIQAGGAEAVRARIPGVGIGQAAVESPVIATVATVDAAAAPVAGPAPIAVLPGETPDGPHYPRPHLSGKAAIQRLVKVVSAYFNRVELHIEARDWIAAEAEHLKGDVRQASEARILAKLIRKGMDPYEAEEVAAVRAERAAPRLAKRAARRAAAVRFGERAASGVMPRIQIKGAAGLGKTQAIIDEYLSRPALWKRNIAIYTRTLDLAEDFKDALAIKAEGMPPAMDGSRPRFMVIRGRQTEGMCDPARLKVVEAAIKAGADSVYRACCHTPAVGDAPESFCPKFNECRYNKQFLDTAPALRLMPHARLKRMQPAELRLPAPDLVIVDESAIGDLVETAMVDPALLTNHATYASAPGDEHLIQEAMDTGRAVVNAVSRGAEAVAMLKADGVKPEHLRAAAVAASLAAKNALPSVWAGMDPEEAKARYRQHEKHEGRAVAAVLSQLARDLEADRLASVGIEWDAEHKARLEDGTNAPHPVIRRHGLAKAIGAPADTALVLLDADANLEINRRLFGADLRGFTVRAVRQAHVTQVLDCTLAASSIAPPDSLPNNQAKAAKMRARIAAMVQRETANGKPVLIITPLKVRRALTGEEGTVHPSTVWHGADMTHFGRHLGANGWTDFDTVIVLGREELPPLVAERIARAIYADAPEVTLDLPGKFGRELRRHDLRTGTAPPVFVRAHPDRRVQQVVEMSRENAMGQGADRLRLIHRDAANPARVVVVSNLPVPGLVVDRLMTLDDALEGGTVWERAFARMPGGVLPLSAEWLAGNLPDLFSSDRTAGRELAKSKVPNGNRYIYCQVALYRTARQRRWSEALIRPDVADARAELARLLGAEVVDFRMMDGPPPDPPAAAPVPVVMTEPDLEPPLIAGAVLTAGAVMDLDALPEVMPGLTPELLYRRCILEPPPVDLLTIRGRDRAPIVLLEVPGMGPFMCAATVSARGLGVPLLMNRPVMPDAWMSAPDPAFLPIQSGGGNAARMV